MTDARKARALVAWFWGAILTVYAALVAKAIAGFGVFYEEVVPYVLVRMDVVSGWNGRSPAGLRFSDEVAGFGPGSRWVVSDALPRLALDVGELRLPILNQVYMTNHLSYLGVGVSKLVGDPVFGPRIAHALFGVATLVLVHDIGRSLLSRRAALLATVLAATSLNLVFMFTWARFDESLPSVASLAVLAALLRFDSDRKARWLWLAAVAAGLGVSAKITTLWPLGAMLVAALVAGVRPRIGGRRFAAMGLFALPWLAPMIVYAALAPGGATAGEAGRRLSFLSDLFTTDVVPRTAANLVSYLGSWGALIGEITRGAGGATPSVVGRVVVVGTLGYLAVAALRPGELPRRKRVETALLVVVGSMVALVAMFYREHQDYQFVLLVPLFSLGVGHALDHLAGALERRSPRRLAPWVAGALVAAVPVAAQAREHLAFWDDLAHSQNAMVDQHVQRESAAFLDEQRIARPITTTFYAVGQYELLTKGRVRPLHASSLFRGDGKDAAPDLRTIWNQLLAVDCESPRFVLIPTGTNPVEQRHFDEPAIRRALLDDQARYPGGVTLVRSFANRAGDVLLELYEVKGCPDGVAPVPGGRSGARATEVERPASPATQAALGGLGPGVRVGSFTIESVSEPVRGAIVIRAGRGATFEVRLASDDPPPPARAGRYAVYYREPRGMSGTVPSNEALVEAAQAIAASLSKVEGAEPLPGLAPLPARPGVEL